MSAVIEIVHRPERLRYEVLSDGVVAGYVTYHLLEGVTVLDHTRIKAAFEGRGLGSVLAEGVLEDLTARDVAYEVQCPFLLGWLARNPDFVPAAR